MCLCYVLRLVRELKLVHETTATDDSDQMLFCSRLCAALSKINFFWGVCLALYGLLAETSVTGWGQAPIHILPSP